MDGKIILSVGGLCVIILLGAIYLSEYDFEGFRATATENEEKCQMQASANENTRALLRNAENEKEVVSNAAELLGNFDDSTRQIITLREKRDSLLKEFLNTVRGVRKHEAGTVMPEVVLKTGQKYTNVKILSVDPSGISITHESGAVHVAAKDLPPNLEEKYRLDMERVVALKLDEPKLKPPGEPVTPIVQKRPPPPPAPVQPAPPVVDPQQAATKADEQRLAALIVQANYYHQQVTQLNTQKNYYLEKAKGFNTRSSYRDGRIHSDPALATHAEDQAKEIDKQLQIALSQSSQADAYVEALRAKMASRH